MKRLKKTTTLYDAGGLLLVIILFGLPFGIIFDYLWNLLVLSLALPRLPRRVAPNPGSIGAGTENITRGRRLAYCFFITLLGVIIDWAYFELTWDTYIARSAVWAPAMTQAFQFTLLLVPVIMLGLVNFALSYSYLKLERRQAAVLAAIMGVFTAPWLLPIVPYTLGWVAL